MRTAERMRSLYTQGVTATADMRPADGARLLRAALALDPRGVDRGRILVSLAHAEAEQGRVELGLRLLDEAQPLLPPGKLGVLHGQRGLFLLRTGRNAVALPHLDKAIELLAEQSQPEDLARALLNRGVLHLADAQGPARADLTRCAGLAVAHGLDRIAAKARHNLAYLDYLAGDLPTALGRYSDVARAYAELSPSALPVLAVDKARALLAAGLFSEADRELAAALQQFRRLRLGQDYAEAELTRAEAALIAGRPALARLWAVHARRRFRLRGNDRWATLASLVALRADLSLAVHQTTLPHRALSLAHTLRALGLAEDARLSTLVAVRALVATGKPDAASRELAKAGRPGGGAGRLDVRLFWRLAQAEVATALGRRGEASRRLAAGLAELHRHRSQLGSLDLQTSAAVHGRDLAQAGLRAALSQGSTAMVYRWVERARAQALLLPPVHPPQDPTMAIALESLRQTRHDLREAEMSGKPTAVLRTRADMLQRQLREHSWRAVGKAVAARYAPLASVKAGLADAAMIIYLRDNANLRALVVLKGKTHLVDLCKYVDAETALLRLRADLDASAGRAMPSRLAAAVAATIRHDAGALARTILEPILGIAGDRELIVVPTGVLVTVPWAVLPGCAQRPVTVTPSATAWMAARHRLRAVDYQSTSAATLLVAGPGNARGDAELREIATLRPRTTTVLTGADATPTATLAALGHVRIAHIAAHGRYEADNALFSALELSGGPLMGYDLQRLTTTPAVVVLSSCDLGMSDVRPGDESLGMVTALLSTGSSSVVASVSRIGDDTAMAVMAGYHKGIRAGLPSPVALANGIGRLATGTAAGFVCFGAG